MNPDFVMFDLKQINNVQTLSLFFTHVYFCFHAPIISLTGLLETKHHSIILCNPGDEDLLFKVHVCVCVCS